MNGLRETQLADGEAIFVAGAGMAGTCGMGDTGLHQAPELPEPAHTGGHAMGEGSQGAGSEESSFCGDVVVPLDSGLQIAPRVSEEEARLAILHLIHEYGHQRAAANGGDGVMTAWANINEALNGWSLK